MATEESSIIWGDPPTPHTGRRGRSGIWGRRLAPFLDRPGEWGMVKKWSSPARAQQAAHQLRKRKVIAPEGRWEFRSAMVDGCGCLYARYLGPDDAANDEGSS